MNGKSWPKNHVNIEQLSKKWYQQLMDKNIPTLHLFESFDFIHSGVKIWFYRRQSLERIACVVRKRESLCCWCGWLVAKEPKQNGCLDETEVGAFGGESRLVEVTSVTERSREFDWRTVELLHIGLDAFGARDLFHFDHLNAFTAGTMATGHVTIWMKKGGEKNQICHETQSFN